MHANLSKFIAIVLFFSISSKSMAHVDVDYPAGGETLTSGEHVTIRWRITIPHNTLNWDVYYSPDGGTTWETIQLDLPAGDLSYTWEVPEGATAQARVRVFQDNSSTDYQDESEVFTIQELSATSHPQSGDFNVEVYPNPAWEIINVDFGLNPTRPVQLSFLDATGKTLWLNDNLSLHNLIPVSLYSSGIYFIRIKNNEGSYLRQVVIK
ncbi:MAG TPA: T9SS type A sorting domain-containing protein [Saprospiraceae bacterium]|nr:T9SS type A sorting domain-containing protein [Saprospiraceae bacterium]